MYRLFHSQIKRSTYNPSARPLLTTVWVKEIIFLSGLDSVARPLSPERLLTASATKPRILSIYSHTVVLSLADEVECVGRFPDAGCSSDTGRSAMLSNISSRVLLRSAVPTSCDVVSKNCGAFGRFPTGWAAIDPLATGQ